MDHRFRIFAEWVVDVILAASRHEVLLDEDDFRSFLQALELGDVLLLLQLRVTVHFIRG